MAEHVIGIDVARVQFTVEAPAEKAHADEHPFRKWEATCSNHVFGSTLFRLAEWQPTLNRENDGSNPSGGTTSRRPKDRTRPCEG